MAEVSRTRGAQRESQAKKVSQPGIIGRSEKMSINTVGEKRSRRTIHQNKLADREKADRQKAFGNGGKSADQEKVKGSGSIKGSDSEIQAQTGYRSG